MSSQEIEIIIPAVKAKPASKKKVIAHSCDVCNKVIDKSQDNRYGSGVSKCSLCKRDICRTRNEDRSYTCFEYDPDEIGDYPDKICIICFPLYIPARREMNKRHWKEEEELEEQIKKESLNAKQD